MSLAKQINIDPHRPPVTGVDINALQSDLPEAGAALSTTGLSNDVADDLARRFDDLRASADRLTHVLNKFTHLDEAGCPPETGGSSVDEKGDGRNTSGQDFDDQDDLMDSFSHLSGKRVMDTVFDFALQIFKQPEVFVHRYTEFAGELLKIVNARSDLSPERGDRRFRDAVWKDNVIYRMVLQTYLAWSREMNQLVSDLAFSSEQDQRRVRFLLEQLDAALSPSNSPLNPAAVKRAYQTGGQSVLTGLQNLLKDIKTNGGMPRQVEPDACEVGNNLANSPGAVVYRNPVYEIIQYAATAKQAVHKTPVLIVPPQINRFYIFDLSPRNSIVKHLLDRGLQVFIVSWRNPTSVHSHWGLETYVTELDKGVDAVRRITQSDEISLVSACAGGITSMSLQAWYAARNKKVIRNHSLLVTALSAEGHPTLDLFLNKTVVKQILSRSKTRGVMDGKELARVFAWMRPKDLVWSYWVNNNLLGKEPPTMDVLFWDNDSTRLPAALHRDFVNVLLNNRFAPGKGFVIDGTRVDLSKMDGDFYFLAGDEDYLMPWKSCYRNLAMMPGAHCEFVLSNSGHIQSVLRPPGIANTRYHTNSHTNDDVTLAPDAWLEQSETHQGSWWQHWSDWLTRRSGDLKPPPAEPGNREYPPLCASPGTYVFEK